MIIKNCRCFDGKEFLEGFVNISITKGLIRDISSIDFEEDSETYDAEGKIVCPGFIDIHTHGIGGYDNSKLNEDEFNLMKGLYNKAGTTKFYPSFPTISSNVMLKSLSLYKKKSKEIPGIHFEGPYINTEKRGAQNPVYIQRPNKERFKEEFSEYMDIISRITIAPEMDENLSFTKYLVSQGIKVSFGHTTCNAEKANKFFDLTDSIATHIFNAMPSIHHRSPSITTVALNRDNVYCEIIPDLIHIHPEIIKLIFKIKGPEKTIAVSDSILATGLPKGVYEFSGLHVTVGETGARLNSGNLAGSTITLAAGVKNIISVGIILEHALMSATSSPANAMGIENSCGYIKKGYTADLLILDDNYSVLKVFLKGKILS
ncbi:MAG: N-acetylglucosamine-6-phosphate deacetylase [Clostridiales bacterium]|nr:N-acetylglucosamine-6-phosphate deacetylase [Clostridiales bacterium]